MAIEIHCVSVVGGWQTAVIATGFRFGPVFNDSKDLWQWQAENLYPPKPGYRWRVTPAGTRIYVNAEGTDIGHVYETSGGMWCGELEPWGRRFDCFTTVGAAMAHVETEMAK